MKNYDRLGEQFCNCSDSPSCYANIADTTTAPTTHRNTIDRPSSSAFFLLPRSHCIFSIFPPCAARECCIRSARVVPMHFCPVMQINFTLLFFNYDNCCAAYMQRGTRKTINNTIDRTIYCAQLNGLRREKNCRRSNRESRRRRHRCGLARCSPLLGKRHQTNSMSLRELHTQGGKLKCIEKTASKKSTAYFYRAIDLIRTSAGNWPQPKTKTAAQHIALLNF